jgi:hypothetical protein
VFVFDDDFVEWAAKTTGLTESLSLQRHRRIALGQ